MGKKTKNRKNKEIILKFREFMYFLFLLLVISISYLENKEVPKIA